MPSPSPSWQTIQIPFSGGLDTKTAKPLVLSGRLIQAENVVMRQRGKIEDRYGFAPIQHPALTSADWCGVLGTGTPGSTSLGQELLVGGQGSQLAWSPAANGWLQKGSVLPGGMTSKTAFAGTADCQAADMALNFHKPTAGGEFSCYAYEVAQGGVHFSVVDDNTGQNVMADTVLDTGGSDPRVVSIGPFFCVFYINRRNVLVVQTIDPVQRTVTPPVVLSSLITQIQTFDARAVANAPTAIGNNGQYVAVAWCYGARALGFTITGFDPWAQAQAGGLTAPTLAATYEIDNLAIGVFSGHLGVIFSSAAVGIELQWLDLSQVAGALVTLDSVVNQWGKLTIGPSVSSSFTAFWETLAVQDKYGNFTTAAAIRTCSGSIAGSGTAPVFASRSMSIAGDLFRLGGATYLPAVYQGNYGSGYTQQFSLQPTYMLLRDGATPVARLAQTNAGGPTLRPRCPQVTVDLAGNYVWAIGLGTQQTAGFNGVWQQVRSVARSVFTYEIQPFSATLGDSLYLTGGFLSTYDGVSFREANYHVTPEPPAVDCCNVACCRVQIGQASLGSVGSGIAFIPDSDDLTQPGGTIHDSGLTFTAIAAGPAGNGIQIYIALTSSTAPTSITTLGRNIVITPITNGTVVTETDGGVIAAFAAYNLANPASALVTASLSPACPGGGTLLANVQTSAQTTAGGGTVSPATAALTPATWTVGTQTFQATLNSTVSLGTVEILDNGVSVASDGITPGTIAGTIGAGIPITGSVTADGIVTVTIAGQMHPNPSDGGTMTVHWSSAPLAPEVSDVYFPPDTANPFATIVASGWQIRPSSYVLITAQSTSATGTPYLQTDGTQGGPVGYVWFTVDGVGANPAPYGSGGVQCALLSTDTAAQCAGKFRQVVNGSLLATYVTASAVVQNVSPPTGISAGVTSKVTVTSVLGLTWSAGAPITYSEDFRLDADWPGGNGATGPTGAWMACPAGNKIMPGGYFVVPTEAFINNQLVVIVFWFSVDGKGAPPAVVGAPSVGDLLLPVLGALGASTGSTVLNIVEIPVLSTDLATTVAKKVIGGGVYPLAMASFASSGPGASTYVLSGPYGSVIQIAMWNSGRYAYLTPYNVSCAGSLPDGFYQYDTDWESNNAKGELDQSGVSRITSVNVQGSAPTFDPYGIKYDAVDGNGKPTSALAQNPNQHGMLLWGSNVGGCAPRLYAPALYATQKPSTTWAPYRSIVSVQGSLFRCTDAAQTFGVQNPVTAAVLNPTLAVPQDLLTFIDTTPDSQLQKNAALYTNGSLTNAPVESCRFLHVHRQRMYAVSWESPNTIRPSQTLNESNQLAVQFPVELTITIDADAGNIIGLGTCDAWLIVFCQYGMFAIGGDGPTAAGTGQFFQPPNRIMTDSGGCISAGSIVTTPEGLWYQSAKGLYFMDRDLVTSYRGADYTKLVAGRSLGAAMLMPNSTEIRWFSTAVPGAATAVSDYALSLNYYAALDAQGQPVSFKSKFTKWAANSCCLWNGNLVWVDGAAIVNVETPGLYLDNGAPIQFLIETAEVHSSLQGYMRATELALLGEFVGTGTATVVVNCAYDYEPPSAPIQWDEQNILNPPSDGGGGDQPPLPDGTRFQFRGFIPDSPNGGCFQSIRFVISGQGVSGDPTDGSTYGGFALTGIQVNAGFFPGIARLGPSRTAS
jgi:hypothetical protein